MWASFIQIILVLTITYQIIYTQAVTIKRSPLELGYVTFPNESGRHKGLVSFNKTNTEMDMEKNIVDLSLPVTSNKISHTHEWIPGQIRHHAFIPAHIHHIYLPVLITPAVIVRPPENVYGYYNRQFGGYGAGAYTGGQGAGHGFQILFNP